MLSKSFNSYIVYFLLLANLHFHFSTFLLYNEINDLIEILFSLSFWYNIYTSVVSFLFRFSSWFSSLNSFVPELKPIWQGLGDFRTEIRNGNTLPFIHHLGFLLKTIPNWYSFEIFDLSLLFESCPKKNWAKQRLRENSFPELLNWNLYLHIVNSRKRILLQKMKADMDMFMGSFLQKHSLLSFE